MMKQKHTIELNKKSFTLIEMLISVSILVLIFTFIYGQFNLAQLSTKKTTQIEKSSTKREKIILLLYNDFLTSSDIVSTSGKNFDRFIVPFSSSNSLYGISNPYIKYIVVESNEGKSLLRLESHTKSIDITGINSKYYMEEIVKDIKYFKIIINKEYIEFYISAKDMKDIYFKFKRVVG